MKFYLGTHEYSWLSRPELEGVPLFVSRRRLQRQKSWRPATTDWALDSGGFTELGMYGCWVTSPGDYVEAVRRYRDEIGRMQWASPQDWMCETVMLKKTGKTLLEHQRLTVDNDTELRMLAPDIRWRRVLQGDHPDDYLRCVDMYEHAGVNFDAEPEVGVGSVCRRQGAPEITDLFRRLSALGLKMHGYGVKSLGVREGGQYLASSDSLAWSMNGRRNGVGPNRATPDCKHQNCANCMAWALQWRAKLLRQIPAQRDPAMSFPCPRHLIEEIPA